ncbi:MAG: hypothetical protein PHU85_15830 [Phycisphaerae bacterium]|nr:hypothetical protein [Phycisphaerae bacterium]
MTQNPSQPSPGDAIQIKPKVHAADALGALAGGANFGAAIQPDDFQPIDLDNPGSMVAPPLPAAGDPPAAPAGTTAPPAADLYADDVLPDLGMPRPTLSPPAPRRRHQLSQGWRHAFIPMLVVGVLMLGIGAWAIKILATTHSQNRRIQGYLLVTAIPVGLILLACAVIVRMELARQERVRRRQSLAATPPQESAAPQAWQMPNVPVPPPANTWPPQSQ